MEQMWHVPVSLTGTYWSATLAIGADSAAAAEEAATIRMDQLLQEGSAAATFQTGPALAVKTS